MDFLAALSALCGWVYTISWSLSFYPQPLLNASRRSTSGTTVDFPFINCLGFLAYLLSNAALCYSPTVRREYAARHHGLTPTAASNDVAFAAHALVLSLVTVSQYFVPTWWGIGARDRAAGTSPRRRPSGFMLGVAAGSTVAVTVFVVLAGMNTGVGPVSESLASSSSPWGWLDVVYVLGYVKLVITFIKYSPQVLVNWRNRSTHGWSIVQIALDFLGGVLSIAQLLIDCLRQGDWSGMTGNPVKLLLGNVSMGYDLIFFVQHYVLYPSEGADEPEVPAVEEEEVNERQALLAPRRDLV